MRAQPTRWKERGADIADAAPSKPWAGASLSPQSWPESKEGAARGHSVNDPFCPFTDPRKKDRIPGSLQNVPMGPSC